MDLGFTAIASFGGVLCILYLVGHSRWWHAFVTPKHVSLPLLEKPGSSLI
jgi:hypothetical protein